MRLRPSGLFVHNSKSIIRERKHHRSVQVIVVAAVKRKGLQTVHVVLCIIGIPMKKVKIVRGRIRVTKIQLPRRWERKNVWEYPNQLFDTLFAPFGKWEMIVFFRILSLWWNVIQLNPHHRDAMRMMQLVRALVASHSPPTSARR